MDEKIICEVCGAEIPPDEAYEYNGQLLCESCYERETITCSHCGERIWSADNAGSDSTPLCQRCYDLYYTNCTSCGRLLNLDDAYYDNEYDDEPYCYDCHVDRQHNHSIHDYYYKPEPEFYGESGRYFGVELEVDGAGERQDSAERILAIANGNGLEHVYCKHDGSLDDGFEIVTHPMSLDYHMNEMPWASVLHAAIQMGYLSHRANTCGLHVHVNRSAFGDTEEQQDQVVARILYFFEKNWDELLIFSRRTQRQLDRWAARYGYKEQPKDILDHAKKGNGAGRYTCVNLTNCDTIEFRMFRGTLKLNTLLATLQMVNRICDVALFLSDEEIKALSWPSFASSCCEPELIQYLKERQLYINEPVETEGEV